jgi:hypothetical protein
MQQPWTHSQIPGEVTLRHSETSNLTTCTVHGYAFTKAEVISGKWLKPVCGDCFDEAVGKLPEPDWADPICQQEGDCAKGVESNMCRKCRKRKCTDHMFVNGPLGVCRDCEGIPARDAMMASDDPGRCAGMTCFRSAAEDGWCKACEEQYCKFCMHEDNLCKNCAALMGAMTSDDGE